MVALQLIYFLNIIVAGFVGITSLFFPTFSSTTIFDETISPNWAQRIVGCLWLAIALTSCLGLFYPLTYSPVLLIQLIYKGSWLLVIVLPKLLTKKPLNDLPIGMTLFFLIWVLGLLICLPYNYLFPH